VSRREFQLIAQVLRRASLDPALDRETVETLAASFTVELAKENERFDSQRFLAAALPAEPVRIDGSDEHDAAVTAA
jgi:hypothetical protein